MKNIILSFALFLLGGNLWAQSNDAVPTLQETLPSFTTLYGLDETQQEKMVEIQKRKFRNLGEIENLKTSDPKKYRQKLDAMQKANVAHMHNLLNEDQLKVFRQKQIDLRKRKAELFKEMKGSGTSQSEVEARMAELDVEALLNG